MDGFNSTIFAYGQSGSGKTFSMLGPEEVTEVLVNGNDIPEEIQELFGIIPRSTFHIFDSVEQGVKRSTQFTIKVSYLEIYNEAINDILCSPPNTNLKLREFVGQGMSVMGLFERCITTPEEVFECLSIATANRIVCATGQNARSSRSHTVFVITVDQTLADGSTKSSRLNLVDLAGSEKLSKTGATGQALKEAQKINLSLTTLGRCIKALTSKTETHVPYRESKLTQILKESLGGNAKTALICTGSMRKVHFEETVGTLKFAERAKQVKNSAKSNVKRSVEELELLVEQLKLEIARLKKMITDKESGVEVSLMSDDKSIEFQELKIKFETLTLASQKQMEQLQAQLEIAQQSQGGGDFLAMHEEIESHRERADEANEQLHKLNALKDEQRKIYEESVEKLKYQIVADDEKMIALRQETNNLNKKVNSLRSELLHNEEAVIQLTQERDRLATQEGLLKDRVGIAEKQLQDENIQRFEAEKQLETLKDQLKLITEEKSIMDASVKKFEQTNEDLTRRIISIEDKEDDYLNQIEKLEKENSNLKKQIQDSKSKNEKSQASLKEEIESSLRDKDTLRNEVFSLQAELKQSHSEIQSLRALLSENMNDKSIIQEREKYVSEITANFQESLARAKEEKNALGGQLKALMAQLEVMRKSEEAKSEEKEKLTSQLKTVNEKYNKTVKELVEEKQSKAKLSVFLRELESYKEENKVIYEQAEKAKEFLIVELEKLTLQKKSFQSDLAYSTETLAKLKEEYMIQTQQLLDEKLKLKQESLAIEKALTEEKEIIEARLELSLAEKKRINGLLDEKTSEFQMAKSKQFELEKELSNAKMQIDSLESDLKQKEREKQMERRSSIMRQSTGFQRRQSILNTKITPNTLLKSGQGSQFGQVQLRKTDNKFLKEAIQEAKHAAQLAPKSGFQVQYGFDEIRALLYGNLDQNIIQEKRELSSSSESDSSNSSSDSDSDSDSDTPSEEETKVEVEA